MILEDDAVVNLDFAHADASGVPFSDQGFMPVDSVTLGSNPLHLPSGQSGLFIHYWAHGQQQLGQVPGGPDGTTMVTVPVAADYTDLQYELVAYTGTPVFSPATGTVTGVQSVVLAQGSLISDPKHVDHLGFSATGVDGTVFTSISAGGKPLGELNFVVHHEPGEVKQAGNLVTLSGGQVTASFVPLHG
jgi:hypothetical protein